MVNSQKNSFPQKSGQTVTRKKYYVNKKNPHGKAENYSLLHVDNVDNFVYNFIFQGFLHV